MSTAMQIVKVLISFVHYNGVSIVNEFYWVHVSCEWAFRTSIIWLFCFYIVSVTLTWYINLLLCLSVCLCLYLCCIPSSWRIKADKCTKTF